MSIRTPTSDPTTSSRPIDPVKCACPRCHCQVIAARAVTREGRVYCSQTCAYDCTETTCVCIHEGCDRDPPPEHGAR